VNIAGTADENILVSFADDPNYRQHNRIWKLINAETLLIEKNLLLPIDASYVLALGREHFLSVGYLNNRWQVYKDQELLYSFSPEMNVVMVKNLGTSYY